MDSGFGGFPLFFRIAFVLVGLLVLVVFVVVVISAVRSRKVLRDSGLDPMTAHAGLAARIAQGPLAQRPRTLEERLGELDDLHRRGTITDAEHAAARKAALDAG